VRKQQLLRHVRDNAVVFGRHGAAREARIHALPAPGKEGAFIRQVKRAPLFSLHGGTGGPCGHAGVTHTPCPALPQDLFGGAYGLTNSVSGAMALGPTDPVVIRPDYWVSFLWKRTLGPQVYNATSSNPALRSYAFSGAPASPFASAPCVSAALQVLLLNLNATDSAQVSLPSVPGAGKQYDAWVLSPDPTGGPFALLAQINGDTLPTTIDVSKQDPRSFLSGITQPPTQGPVSSGVSVPPLSTAFVCY
jgi:hypothetical protein